MNIPALNSSLPRKVWLAACSLAFLALPGPAPAQDREPVLKVQVVPPPLLAASPESRFAELFALSLRHALARQGLAWPVAELRPVENPAKVPYLLRIDVTDWRIARDGNFESTFSAILRTPHGERNLGTYADTRWAAGVVQSGGGHPFFALSADAIQALGRDLAASDLLPPGKKPAPALARR